MEIEPGVVECVVLYLIEEFSELISDLLLTSLLINQIDKVLFVVLSVSFLNVEFGCLVTFIEVLAYHNGRRPLHVWFHGPHKRDRATDLNVSCN